MGPIISTTYIVLLLLNDAMIMKVKWYKTQIHGQTRIQPIDVN